MLLNTRANAEFVAATDEAVDHMFSDFESIIRTRSDAK